MKRLWLILLGILLLTGCRHPEKFSEVPSIRFVSLDKVDDGSGKDNQAYLVVHFQDGDGDIGLDDGDTTGVFAIDSAFYYNFFIDFYEKQEGEWVLVELPTPLHSRVPYLSDAVPESIEGDISILTYVNNFFSPYDTIKLKCRLVDRALHVSNEIETPEIIVNK